MKAVTEEASDVIEGSYATATKGCADYGLKVIEAARANTNAQFDYAGKLMAVKRRWSSCRPRIFAASSKR